MEGTDGADPGINRQRFSVQRHFGEAQAIGIPAGRRVPPDNLPLGGVGEEHAWSRPRGAGS